MGDPCKLMINQKAGLPNSKTEKTRLAKKKKKKKKPTMEQKHEK